MMPCLYKYYHHASSLGYKIYFLKKILSYRKNYSCKDYLLFGFILLHQVFLLSQFFSGIFYAWIPMFSFIHVNENFSCIWFEHRTVSSIACIFSQLIH